MDLKKRESTAESARPARLGRQTEDGRLLEAPVPEPAVFVHTDPWRVLRIMGEFVAGFDELADLGPAVTMFGSARTPPDDPTYQQAVETARLLGEAGFAIITGGGPGIMEAGNRGAVEAGAVSVGLGIELPYEQKFNDYVTQSLEFNYFFTRKTMFLKYAQAYLIFPGGWGTMDEMMEALTLMQTDKIKNFPIILFGLDYWQGLLDFFRNPMLAGGKISPSDFDIFTVTDSPQEVVEVVVSSFRERERQRKGEVKKR